MVLHLNQIGIRIFLRPIDNQSIVDFFGRRFRIGCREIGGRRFIHVVETIHASIDAFRNFQPPQIPTAMAIGIKSDADLQN